MSGRADERQRVVALHTPGRPTPAADHLALAMVLAVASLIAAACAGGDDRDVATTDVSINLNAPGTSIDPRILGTNIPAWLGPERFAADWFRDAVVASGATTIRMPGGSWSNRYDWLGCELGDEERCRWPWASRPSDFVDLLVDLDLDGVWTVSINDTAQGAAALVAFFNGSVDDATVIGVDRNGEDWRTVATWAELRREGGHPDPVGIDLWEVGNEVYGGKPEAAGTECASFGWETVWTCDGTEYMVGDDAHDGFLDIRAAMRAVDPTIEVGAVGVADPESWANWGNEVIEAAAGDLDFYVVHHYGFNRSPSVQEAVDRPAEYWPTALDVTRDLLPDDAVLAVTEFNLISFAAGDDEQSMTRVLNALYVADTIGQFAAHDVALANQWNLANGTLENGTDYGLVDADDGSRYPQFEAVAMWSRAGDELLEYAATESLADDVRIYPTRRPDGHLAVLVFNLGGAARALELQLSGASTVENAVVETVMADDPTATEFEHSGPVAAIVRSDVVAASIPPWSLNLIEVGFDS
jgi:hypothetical protein